ncbi:adenosylcobinamide-phosphate synthase CbiB [Sphingobium sp. CR28]|uniref:adenosylcobinamide-phosphate synthase CbiB n=1 Tax=Sphingobium sp. CR28 TaxID=3400272 RepID=UPI003FED5C80
MAEPVALLALLIDAACGWPSRLYALVGHPVGAFARFLDWAERHWNSPARTDKARRLLGIVTIVVLDGVTAGVGVGAERLLHSILGGGAWIGIALFAWPGIAARSLYYHVRAVADALRQGDLPQARRAVSMIVGRDTEALDEAGIARAAIESLSESFCDGVVAPLFWLLVAGLPGVWAYKAINTADSMIGHREPRWRAFGWAAARTDDVANLIPARLSAVLICLAGKGGWRVTWRDHARHASPNAGWPEAAMAGALGLSLAGPVTYDGVLHEKPWIGGEGRQSTGSDVRRALRVYLRACLLLAILTGGIAWLR